jgi:hypothetical protein
MARQLGVPIRTWYNYESGVTVPAEVLLRFMELTAVEPNWLLRGRGPKFRTTPPALEGGADSAQTVRNLLRTALQHLERRNEAMRLAGEPGAEVAPERPTGMPAGLSALASPAKVEGGVYAHAEWLAAEREGRCVLVKGEAMAPIVASGARVAYAAEPESPRDLDGAMVVAWVEGQPLVRWFRLTGTYGLLRAENPDFTPSIILLDLKERGAGPKLRRVLWIGTPH